jgi:excinuclease ABC subunit B
MRFKLKSAYEPSGDQPTAIAQLVAGIREGENHQVLLGVTGSGKTFTIANVIEQVQRPTLVLSHNKTLAAQLYNEFKTFFPENRVEFFISYYDYYQPEAYIAATDTYIEKDLAINEEIEKLRLRATSALLSGRKDVIIVTSVSCIYGIGKPEEYAAHVIHLEAGQRVNRRQFLHRLVELLYSRTEIEFKPGQFRVKGDTVDVFPAYDDTAVRIQFWGDEIEKIQQIDPVSGRKIFDYQDFTLYPANLFVTSRETLNRALNDIQDEMMQQVDYFTRAGLTTEAKRIKERTEYDLEMMRELGFCKGIENYSRHLTQRRPGERPYCLIDYFSQDSLIVIDESHVSVPQIRGMWGGDRSRKLMLVENGFRLPSALDNRPLKFDEFEELAHQIVYVSATPGDYELTKSGGVVVEQVVRPTGLLDPPVEVRPLVNQVDDLLEEVHKAVARQERVLVTTLTKRMSEELARYLAELGINVNYLHSEIDALKRVEVLRDLREGKIDVLIGINLLREGLDLPEVALVAILDADKEGFLRSERAFIQIAGRAARNAAGRVILYADRVTDSMQKLIDETERRRAKQMRFNTEHGITPRTVYRAHDNSLVDTFKGQGYGERTAAVSDKPTTFDPVVDRMTEEQLRRLVAETRKKMEAAATELDFMLAARHRDEMLALEKLCQQKFGTK